MERGASELDLKGRLGRGVLGRQTGGQGGVRKHGLVGTDWVFRELGGHGLRDAEGGKSGGRGFSGPRAAWMRSWVFILVSPQDRHWDREQMGSQEEAVAAEHQHGEDYRQGRLSLEATWQLLQGLWKVWTLSRHWRGT